LPEFCGKRSPGWQALTNRHEARGFAGKFLVRVAGNGDLPGLTVHQVFPRKFLDQIAVDMPRLEQRNAVLQADARIAHLRELFLLDADGHAGVGERKRAALAPDGVVAEISNDRGAESWAEGSRKKPCHTTPDPHKPNESQTDSSGQEFYR
jgi:hypothetical protein